MKKFTTLLCLLIPIFLQAQFNTDARPLVPAKWYVNDNSLTGDVFTSAIGNDANAGTTAAPFATLQQGLSVAQAGDSIFVDAGTYATTDFSITKGVSYVGTNYKISPNNPSNKLLPNPAINAESIITGATITLAANNISLLGLTFDSGGKVAVSLDNTSTSNNNFGNFSFIKNRLKINGGTSQVVLVGVGVATTIVSSLVNSTFIITDNRFEKFNSTTNSTFSVHLVKNVTISDNSFVVTGTTFQTQTALSFGNVGVVDLLTVSNNIVDRGASFVAGGRMSATVISSNTIYNTTTAMNVNNGYFEGGGFRFTSNTIIGNLGITGAVLFTRSNGASTGSFSDLRFDNNIFNITAVPGVTTILGSLNINITSSVFTPGLLVRGNKITYSGNLASLEGQNIRAMVFRGRLLNCLVDRNDIILTGTNLQPANPTVSLPVCTGISLYSDNGSSASLPDGSVLNFLNNKVSGFKQSFVVYDPTNVANTGDAYLGYGNLGPNITVNVNDNSFTNDSMSINNGENSNIIEATCNWYGYTAVQDLIPKLSIETGNYVPWVTNGTDANVLDGFQPGTGTCNGTPMIATLDGVFNITTCGGSNGAIQISISGGVTPYVYAWRKDGNPGFNSTVQDPSNLSAGTYHVTVTDALGTNLLLDANGDLFTVNVTLADPVTPIPVITANGNNLQSSAAAGNQWYLNGSIITSAINQVYTPLASGSYTVRVTINNCSPAVSTAFSYIVTGLPNIDVFENHIKVFPNPVQDNLVISQSGPVSTLNIRVLDLQGRELRKINSGLTRIDIDMRKYEAGTYIIWIEDTRNKTRGKKLIVKL